MPSRNSLKEYAEDSYYHVYNRGVEKRIIFLDDDDYTVFLGLLKKYLSGDKKDANTNNRHRFPVIGHELQLLAYCLMPNHVHLLFYQKTRDGLPKLMRRVMTGYAMYFNAKYNRVGSLFQGRYKASRINAEAYLQHISRYIHLNPSDYKTWPYSSLVYYGGQKQTPAWLDTQPILAIFEERRVDYLEFVDQYVDTKRELDAIKWQLANNLEDE
jgi:putative transposase